MKKIDLWEVFSYCGLVAAVIAQICVGDWFILGQSLFAVSNIINVVRDWKLKLPTSNLVKDVIFFGISIGMVILDLI